jgi:predicted transcriptional regulator
MKKGTSFYVRVTDDMRKNLKKIAEREAQTVSNVIRSAIEQYLKKQAA